MTLRANSAFGLVAAGYREDGCERHVVVDAALGASPQSQADEPHAGNPELVVRRGQVLQMPQLLGGHQP